MDRKPGTYERALAFHIAARELASSGTAFSVPSEGADALGELVHVQERIAHVLDQLGWWHQQLQAGTHHVEDRQSIEGVLEAAFELQTAARQAAELHQTLVRAHHATSQIRWSDSDSGTGRK
jgi:hypothetical protein